MDAVAASGLLGTPVVGVAAGISRPASKPEFAAYAAKSAEERQGAAAPAVAACSVVSVVGGASELRASPSEAASPACAVTVPPLPARGKIRN